jgi:hypothetical protein
MVVNDNAFFQDARVVLAFFAVGASLLAMDVNDNAFFQDACVDLAFFASKLAPTVGSGRCFQARVLL